MIHIEIKEHIRATPQQVLQCYRERSFYAQRYRDSDIKSYVIDALDTNGPRVRLTLYLVLNTHYLPSMMKRLLGKRQALGYAIDWSQANKGQAQANFSYHVEGLPVKVTGNIDLVPSGQGVAFLVSAEVLCTKAFFARLVEPLIAASAEKEIRADILAMQRHVNESGNACPIA